MVARITFPDWNKTPAKAGDPKDVGSVPQLRISPAEGNGNPFQYSCLENSMVRGAWWATVSGVAKSLSRLSTHTHTNTHTHNVALLLKLVVE